MGSEGQVRNTARSAEAAIEQMKTAWPVGMSVEVFQDGAGMEGSWFEAVIQDHEFDAKCVVEYLELHEGDDEEDAHESHKKSKKEDKKKKKEKVVEEGPPKLFVQPEPVKYLRPLPPKRDGKEMADWQASLKPGSAADLKFDGGFWEVELVRIEKPKKVSFGPGSAGGGGGGGSSSKDGEKKPLTWLVRSVHYEVEHQATLDLLRPPWDWQGDVSGEPDEWKERPPPEVLFLDGKLRSLIEDEKDEKNKALGKKGGPKKFGVSEDGAPKAKANAFGVGTQKVGRDGEMWEVVHKGSRDGDSSGLMEVWRRVQKDEPEWMKEEKAKARAKRRLSEGGQLEGDEEYDDDDDEEMENNDENYGGMHNTHARTQPKGTHRHPHPHTHLFPPPPPSSSPLF